MNVTDLSSTCSQNLCTNWVGKPLMQMHLPNRSNFKIYAKRQSNTSKTVVLWLKCSFSKIFITSWHNCCPVSMYFLGKTKWKKITISGAKWIHSLTGALWVHLGTGLIQSQKGANKFAILQGLISIPAPCISVLGDVYIGSSALH